MFQRPAYNYFQTPNGKNYYMQSTRFNLDIFSRIKTKDLFLNFFFNVYLFLGQRETEHERGRGRERGRHRIGNRLQVLSHQPRA